MPNAQAPPPEKHKLDIWIIENDPAVAHLTKEAFKNAGLAEGVVAIPNGDEALSLLRREDQYTHQEPPDLICLDLHLPKKPGLQVLAEIKSDPKLKITPVLVISGSDDPAEIREAYELHASCYIRKPDDLDKFLYFVQVCFEFWANVVTLPRKPELLATRGA